MSRSVRTPARRPSRSVTNTESPVPVRWIARRQAATGVPGPTVTGSRRPTTMRGWEVRAGTRAVTARSVSSATGPVYAERPDRAAGALRPGCAAGSPAGGATAASVVRRRAAPRGPRPSSRRAPAMTNETSDPTPRNVKPRACEAATDAPSRSRIPAALPCRRHGGDDPVQGGGEVRVVDLAGDAHAVRQVGGPDEQDVDAVDRGEVVRGRDRLGRLHLEHAEERLVDAGGDVGVVDRPVARARG